MACADVLPVYNYRPVRLLGRCANTQGVSRKGFRWLETAIHDTDCLASQALFGEER